MKLDCIILYSIVAGMAALSTFTAGLGSQIDVRTVVVVNGVLIFLMAFTGIYCHTLGGHTDEGSVS